MTFGLLLALASLATAPAAQADVARVSAIEGGSVTIQHADATQVTASVNTPVLAGDVVVTSPQTHAELQLSGVVALQLGGNAQVRVVKNASQLRDVQLAEGTLVLSIVQPQTNAVEIDTPSVTLRAMRAGRYRMSVRDDGTTVATARSGSAEVVTPQQSYGIADGQSIVARGAPGAPQVAYAALPEDDAMDAFAGTRDRTTSDAVQSDSSIPAWIAGFSDLANYGQWIQVAPYGSVWTPSVPTAWAPFRYGSWTWANGYGWTWVADEPWGWAPFHYGRWFSCPSYGWCWCPPAAIGSYAWYPATVGFISYSYFSGAVIGTPYWGWVPLAPYEPFYAWYPPGGWRLYRTHRHPIAYRNLKLGATSTRGPLRQAVSKRCSR
jgi:hypothetical protein